MQRRSYLSVGVATLTCGDSTASAKRRCVHSYSVLRTRGSLRFALYSRSRRVNDLKSETGRTIAFTQNQRYVPLARLKVARTTSELVG